MKDFQKNFAARLTQFRAGAEKDAFWRGYDLNAGKMGRYENQKGLPSLEKFIEICEKTNLSPNYLLMGLEDEAQKLSDDAASQQTKELHDVTRIIKRIGTSAVSKDVTPRSTGKITQRGEKHFPSGRTPGHQGRKSRQK